MDNLLGQTGNKDCFKLPEHYFDTFQSRLEQQIDQLESGKEKAGLPPTLFQKIKPYLYLAAMFVLLFAGLHIAMKFLPAESLGNQPLQATTSIDSLYEPIYLEQTYTAEDILMTSLEGSSLVYYLYLDEND